MTRKEDPLLGALWTMIWPFLTVFYCIAHIGLILLILLLFIGIFLIFLLYFKFRLLRKSRLQENDDHIIGFFHPYCDAGGGGERVLWCAIRAIQKRFPAVKIIIYTGDVNPGDQIIARAMQRFNLSLNSSQLEFIYLHRRKWVEADMYPYFTLLGQSLGSVFLGLEALEKCIPNVYLDTMGYAFTLPLFKYLGGCKVGCYVHYPTISTDMLDKVRTRRAGFNNKRGIANNRFATKFKLFYYKVFAWMYGKAGQCSDLSMVNSSWTEDHINKLWCQKRKDESTIHKIYPPCDVAKFKQLQRDKDQDSEDCDKIKTIVSIGQFRPEKDHALQIRAMFELRQILEESEWSKVRLVLIGGCRNAEDEQRVQDLRDLCKHLSVESNVEFKLNVSFSDLCEAMRTAFIGLHTMENEHFGIAVVEMLAAGLLTIAHRSGGPLMDIVVEETNGRNGFLAGHDKEYAGVISYILGMNPEGRQAIRDRARSSVDRFSDRDFEMGWIRVTESLIN